MILFITGNDTNIGKTFVAALLTDCLSEKYKSIAVVKPIESGVNSTNKSDLDLIKALNKHNLDKLDFFNFYSFKKPLAPLTASILAKTNIKKEQITKNIHKLSKLYDLVIVEGAGGLRVPIGKNFNGVDSKIVKGELKVSGPMITLGYINKALNKEKFIFNLSLQRV